MIKTPLSTVIGGAFWTPSTTILGSTSKTLNQIIKSLFANNEQGFAYDPNDLTTMWQDQAKLLPVAGKGQPVWHILDKSGNNNHAFATSSATRPILQRNATTGAYYLAFDGADDSLQTNNINFTSTDKVSVFAGVRKLSDATSGILVELSNSTLANNGAFHIEAPSGQLTNNYGFASKGTIRQIAQSVASYPSPNSAVLVGIGVISTDTELLRINGIQSASSAGDQGIGNYGNYPLYIGRRGGTSLPFNGHIYGLIGIGKLTSDNETAAIEKELAKRTGVTLNV